MSDSEIWMGEFYQPSRPDVKYQGFLEYLPNKYIKLTLISGKNISKTDVFEDNTGNYNIFGNIVDMGKVTLIGGTSNRRWHNWQYQKIEITYQYLIKNIHLNTSENQIFAFRFSFDGFGNFCSNFTGRQLYYNKPLMSCEVDDKNFQIINKPREECSIAYLLRPYHRNKDTISKIKKMLEEQPLYLANFEPYFCIKSKTKNSFLDVIKLKASVEKLIAVFIVQSVESDKFFISVKEKRKTSEYEVLGIPIIKAKYAVPEYNSLPVTLHSIKDNFSTIWKLWKEMTVDDFNIINIVLHNRLLHGVMSEGYQSLIMYESFIGDWQIKYGNDKNENGRYEHFFQENLSTTDDVLYKKLKEILPTVETIKDIFSIIREMRNCISHTDNKSKNKDSYKNNKQILEDEIKVKNLCSTLFLVILRAVHRKMNIQKTPLQEYIFNNSAGKWSRTSY